MSGYFEGWLFVSACLSLVALVGWFACFMTALEEEPGTTWRYNEMRDARKCLVFVTLSWLWPVVPPVALAYGIFRTLREAA